MSVTAIRIQLFPTPYNPTDPRSERAEAVRIGALNIPLTETSVRDVTPVELRAPGYIPAKGVEGWGIAFAREKVGVSYFPAVCVVEIDIPVELQGLVESENTLTIDTFTRRSEAPNFDGDGHVIDYTNFYLRPQYSIFTGDGQHMGDGQATLLQAQDALGYGYGPTPISISIAISWVATESLFWTNFRACVEDV